MNNRMAAACGCHTGRIRKTNEDNFCFNGIYLDEQNNGLKEILTIDAIPARGFRIAVFDGVSGEDNGELASHAAAASMAKYRLRVSDRMNPAWMFSSLCDELNAAVLAARHGRSVKQMGTTMAALYMGFRHVYVCNIGDSRVYRMRNGKLKMLSVDHVEYKIGRPGSKATLDQYLGIDPEELRLEPHIVKVKKRQGDRYLVCTDGLTDMLPDESIREIINTHQNCAPCVSRLIEEALAQGGRDNITVMLCQVI